MKYGERSLMKQDEDQEPPFPRVGLGKSIAARLFPFYRASGIRYPHILTILSSLRTAPRSFQTRKKKEAHRPEFIPNRFVRLTRCPHTALRQLDHPPSFIVFLFFFSQGPDRLFERGEGPIDSRSTRPRKTRSRV